MNPATGESIPPESSRSPLPPDPSGRPRRPGSGSAKTYARSSDFRVDRELGMVKIDFRLGARRQNCVAYPGGKLERAEREALVRPPRLGLEAALSAGNGRACYLDGGSEHGLDAFRGLDRTGEAVDTGRSGQEKLRVAGVLLRDGDEVSSGVHLDLVFQAGRAEPPVELGSEPVLELPAVSEFQEYLADLDQVEGFHSNLLSLEPAISVGGGFEEGVHVGLRAELPG